MLTRHEGEVTSFLRSVHDQGCGTVRANVLKGWFGLNNASKTIWREILERWRDISEVPLLVGQGDGVFSFAYGEGLKVEEGAWFHDIESWT